MVTSAKVKENADPQASVAVAVAKDGVAGQSIVDVGGKAAITGAVVSVTLIVCVAVEEFPQTSVAVQVLVTEYAPAHPPLVVTSLKVKEATVPQLSVALACAKEGVAGQLMVDVPGKAAITGAVVSLIVIVLVTGAKALPQESVAVQV